MPETVIARFSMRWEADLAQGFLDDADVPSRIVSDGAAGGQPYVGGLAGASLLVSTDHAQSARRVLEAAGVLEPPGGSREVEETHQPLPPVLQADHDDLMEELEAAQKAELKHFVRAMLGMSPAAVIPFIGLAREGNVALLAVLCVLVVFAEGWRWIQAGRRVRRLKIALTDLQERADGL